jgi:stage II sporulation protein D
LGAGACVPRAELAPETGTVQVQLGEAPPQIEPLRKGPALNGTPLRVLLRRGVQGLKISAPGGLRLVHPRTHEALVELPPQGHGRLGSLAGGLAFNGKGLGLDFALVEPLVDGQAVKVAGRRYRGYLGLQVSGSQLLLLNIVGMEDYLRGVLPSEIPSDWPLEALKAQAVAARSFAASHIGKAKQAWDVDDSVSSQVYKGLGEERPKSSAAVDATRGLVLTHAGKVLEAFFHSNSGGHTADVSEVWGGSSRVMYGVLDTYSEDQKHYAWNASVPLEEAQRRLERAGLWSGGLLEEILGGEESDSGRWLTVKLSGGGKVKAVKAAELRNALGVDRLRSTRFRVRTRGDVLVFDGLGWGHGVGLSQEGALVQAQQGWTSRRILAFYYPGASLARLGER